MSSSKVLVLNAGSSSLKFKLFDFVQGSLAPAVSGLIERIGDAANSRIILQGATSGKETAQVPIEDHSVGLKHTFELLKEKVSASIADDVKAVGHRVVHGGSFSESVAFDKDSLAEIERAAVFAPLHNPANISGVRAAQAFFPGRTQVGVFDTAFHQTMPPAAYLYALPYDLYTEKGIRRYGFHGTSYKYLTATAAEILGKPESEANLIIGHLGAGSSMCAVRKGQSNDTSMGMTPLEGLVMGSRCGDIDPGLLPFLSGQGMSIQDIDKLMNKQSGLLGLAGSVDLRAVIADADTGNEQSRRAVEVYVHRIRKYLGAYMLQLGGELDAIVFSAGIGENSAMIRGLVCDGLEPFGIELDAAANARAVGIAATISAPRSRVRVLVVPTDEELRIAQDTVALAGLR